MSIADKLVTVAENVEKVYNAGFEAGKAEGGSAPAWTQCAYNIRFKSDDWADEETTIYIPNWSDISNMFWNVQITKLKKLTIKSDTPITYATNAFFAPQITPPSVLETLVLECDFEQCTKFDNWLMRQNKLKRIEGQPFNLSGAAVFNGFTAYAYAIEYFRVVPNTIKVSFDIKHCSKLDDGTIQSVVDGLADLTDGDSQTLTLNADVKEKIEKDDALADDAVDENGEPLKKFWLRDIISKNWTVA